MPDVGVIRIRVMSLASLRPAPPRKALPLLHRSYRLMRQTKSLPPPSVVPRSVGLCRLLPAPAGRWSFPTLSLRILPWMLGPVSRRLAWCICPFLPTQHWSSPYRPDGSTHATPRLKQLHAELCFETVAIRHLRASRFAHHPNCPHGCTSLRTPRLWLLHPSRT